MITFQKKPESKLEQLIELKRRIAELEIGVKSLLTDATNEAINLLSGKGNIAYQSNKAKVIVRFNKSYQSAKDNVTLARISADIDNELSYLASQNKEQLDQIQEAIDNLTNSIASLESEQEKLLSSSRLIKLQKQYEEEKLKTEELIPNIAVQLKF